MCQAIQDMTSEAKQDTKKDIAFKLHDVNGFTLENIVPIVGESIDTVQQWFAERASAASQP